MSRRSPPRQPTPDEVPDVSKLNLNRLANLPTDVLVLVLELTQQSTSVDDVCRRVQTYCATAKDPSTSGCGNDLWETACSAIGVTQPWGFASFQGPPDERVPAGDDPWKATFRNWCALLRDAVVAERDAQGWWPPGPGRDDDRRDASLEREFANPRKWSDADLVASARGQKPVYRNVTYQNVTYHRWVVHLRCGLVMDTALRMTPPATKLVDRFRPSFSVADNSAMVTANHTSAETATALEQGLVFLARRLVDDANKFVAAEAPPNPDNAPDDAPDDANDNLEPLELMELQLVPAPRVAPRLIISTSQKYQLLDAAAEQHHQLDTTTDALVDPRAIATTLRIFDDLIAVADNERTFLNDGVPTGLRTFERIGEALENNAFAVVRHFYTRDPDGFWNENTLGPGLPLVGATQSRFENVASLRLLAMVLNDGTLVEKTAPTDLFTFNASESSFVAFLDELKPKRLPSTISRWDISAHHLNRSRGAFAARLAAVVANNGLANLTNLRIRFRVDDVYIFGALSEFLGGDHQTRIVDLVQAVFNANHLPSLSELTLEDFVSLDGAMQSLSALPPQHVAPAQLRDLAIIKCGVYAAGLAALLGYLQRPGGAMQLRDVRLVRCSCEERIVPGSDEDDLMALFTDDDDDDDQERTTSPLDRLSPSPSSVAFPELRTFSMTNCVMAPVDVRALATAIGNGAMPMLNDLDLSTNTLAAGGIQHLGTALGNRSPTRLSLVKLDLSFNLLNDDELGAFFDRLTSGDVGQPTAPLLPRFNNLVLKDCMLTTLAPILKAMLSKRVFRADGDLTLDVSGNDLTTASVKALLTTDLSDSGGFATLVLSFNNRVDGGELYQDLVRALTNRFLGRQLRRLWINSLDKPFRDPVNTTVVLRAAAEEAGVEFF